MAGIFEGFLDTSASMGLRVRMPGALREGAGLARRDSDQGEHQGAMVAALDFPRDKLLSDFARTPHSSAHETILVRCAGDTEVRGEGRRGVAEVVAMERDTGIRRNDGQKGTDGGGPQKGHS